MSEGSATSAPADASGQAYRTNGFMFSDLRDYTRYVETHGDEVGAALLGRYRVLVREVVGRFGGAEIKTEGDSFYVVFPSASSAVRCGVALVEAALAPPDGGEPIRVGVGIHAGETVETGEGYVGSAVNIAARICSAAQAGEVLVSETVRALTRTLLPVRFEPRGRRRLKGIAEPFTLFAVVPAGGALATAPVIARRRLPALVAGGVVLVSVVIGLGALAMAMAGGAGEGNGATPAAVASPTATPESPPAQPILTVSPTGTPEVPRAVRRLLEQAPLAYRDRCAPSDDPLPGASASIACSLPFGVDADEVWYDRFDAPAQLALNMDRLVARHGLEEGGCRPEASVGHGTWSVGSIWSGRRACLEQEAVAWIWWSYDRELILARVVRRDGGWPSLLDWWNEHTILLGPSL